MVEFRVLGPLEVRDRGEVVPVKARSLLAALLLSANKVVTVDHLVGAVWGDDPPESAVANLRNQVVVIRRLGARVVTCPGGYSLQVGPGELDLEVFEDMVRQGRRMARRHRHAAAAGLFGRALELWRGPALANVELRGTTRAAAARLGEARMTVVEEWARSGLACGAKDVAGELTGLVIEHPLREPLWALLMLALHRAGRRADALAAYERARRVLADELGLDPGLELRRLRHQIITDDPALLCSA
ncbi:hypothetical protein Lesp02_09630 [Lentzea sp. NBRC 105346]|uniref:AfsR/SARP family transcriptional regulator n=1 Tax=Lentzea sp. NBRC 105346 TaxID=3032205 RepID=UPI0024A424E4|nr:AfsR/SARP family transcriptional regulator [Lentzea sp. NBRC 105346]GLZ28773.1 hypothetical protein Lesp02_09630 [Lentzea sp. NBRC 105346]